MATDTGIGSVAGIWRFPVKSMRGQRLERAEVTERGLVGDRAYALIDADTGKVAASGKDGVLSLSIPKRNAESDGARRIPIGKG